MFRGTTPIIEMELNVDTSLIEVMYVSFVQKNEVKFEKLVSDCQLAGTKASVQLTQEETLSLTAGVPLHIQVRLRLTDGTTLASDIERMTVQDVYKDEVI